MWSQTDLVVFKKHLDQRGEFVERKLYEYDGVIHELPDNGGAYVVSRGISERSSEKGA